MADKHELEIEIGKDGETKVHIKGVKGKKCAEYMEVFNEILGKIKSQKQTSEYYEPETRISTDIKRR